MKQMEKKNNNYYKIWFDPEDPSGFGSISKTAKAMKTSKKEAERSISIQSQQTDTKEISNEKVSS